MRRYPDRTAIYSPQGQKISFAQLNSAIANLADLMFDNGVRAGSNVCCEIENFAVVVASWFAVWRLGANLITSQAPERFQIGGIDAEFSLVSVGNKPKSRIGIEVGENTMVDEPGTFPTAPAGKTFFFTVNTSREPRVLALSAKNVVRDAELYTELLGPPKGAVFLTTGLDSLRAIRDVLRAFSAGQAVIGPDISAETMWSISRELNVKELLLSPLGLHQVLESAPGDLSEHGFERILIGAGMPEPSVLKHAQEEFGDIIELIAGTAESSVYSWKKYDPATHIAGNVGFPACGIRMKVFAEDGGRAKNGTVGRLGFRVPKKQCFEGYLNGPPAYDEDRWMYPGFLARKEKDGSFTKISRTDDRINLGGTRLFSGKVEAALEKLPSIDCAAAIRVFTRSGKPVLGLALQVNDKFEASSVDDILKRSLKGVGGIELRRVDSLPKTKSGDPDRDWVENNWKSLPSFDLG